MIPTEIISFGVNTLVGGFLKLSANARENRDQEYKLILQSSLAQANIYKEAREFQGGWGFSWTRRVIAILAVLSIIVLPKIVILYNPDLAIIYGSEIYETIKNDVVSQTSWDWAKGALIITPLDTHLMSAIIGLFFGSEIAKRR